jgi:hypothetical protein
LGGSYREHKYPLLHGPAADFPHIGNAISVNFQRLRNPCRGWPDHRCSVALRVGAADPPGVA